MSEFDPKTRQFTDSNGDTWDLTITVAALKRCQELAGIDLAAKVESDLFDELADNPILLCNTLAAIVRPQMDDRRIDDEKFAAGLGGDVIDDAVQALIEALVYFFRNRHGGIVAEAKRKAEERKAEPGKARERRELPKPGEIAAAGQPKTSIAGTFAAWAVSGMGASSEMQRTAKATEKTAALLERMERRRDRGKFVFTGTDSPIA